MTRPELGSPGVSYRDLRRFERNFGYEDLGASNPKGPGWVKPLLDYPSRHVQIHVANNVGSGQGASLSISRSMNGQSTLHMISSLSDCASPASLALPDFAERSTGTAQGKGPIGRRRRMCMKRKRMFCIILIGDIPDLSEHHANESEIFTILNIGIIRSNLQHSLSQSSG